MNKLVNEWLSISRYDLDTARAMLISKRYLYVAFMCQQAIEKILKARFVSSNKEKDLPPRIHNLLYLADTVGVELPENDKLLLAELGQFYLEGRYPGKQQELAKAFNAAKAKDILSKTEKVWKWLKQELP